MASVDQEGRVLRKEGPMKHNNSSFQADRRTSSSGGGSRGKGERGGRGRDEKHLTL